jgi:hypothetical protein
VFHHGSKFGSFVPLPIALAMYLLLSCWTVFYDHCVGKKISFMLVCHLFFFLCQNLRDVGPPLVLFCCFSVEFIDH